MRIRFVCFLKLGVKLLESVLSLRGMERNKPLQFLRTAAELHPTSKIVLVAIGLYAQNTAKFNL